MKYSLVICGVLVACLMVSAAIRPTFALAQGESLQISPVFQDIVVVGDASSSGSITLRNNTSTQQTFEILARDVPLFDDQGQEVVLDTQAHSSDSVEYDLADFIIFEQDSWTLEAGETQSIPFDIIPSSDLAPGGHYAAILAKAVSEASSTAFISQALSAYVLLSKLGGERYDLTLIDTDINIGKVVLGIPRDLILNFSNQGTIHVRPRGVLTFSTPWDSVVARGIVNEASLFVMPGSQRKIKVEVNNPSFSWWPVMVYSLKIEGRSDPGQVLYSFSDRIIVIGPVGILVLLCLLVMMFLSLFRVYEEKYSNKKTTLS